MPLVLDVGVSDAAGTNRRAWTAQVAVVLAGRSAYEREDGNAACAVLMPGAVPELVSQVIVPNENVSVYGPPDAA